MTYGHGDDAYRYGNQVKVDFSTNIYQQADLSGLRQHLADHFGVVAHYPEPATHQLEGMLAEWLGVPANTIMVTSGATEAIYLVAQLYAGWASVIPQPTFNEYEDACRTFNHLISYNTGDELELLPDDRVYWLCNPNNPTGNVIMRPLVNRIVRQHPRYIHVIDQSYANYTLSPMLEPRQLVDCYNIILIHSLSKRYCIPGLRLGYLFASPIIIGRLRELRQPWTVNALAIEAGKYLVANNPQVIPSLSDYLAEARRLHQRLSELEGVMVMDTATNFMLAHIDQGTTPHLKQWLIEHHGLLIRDASNFRSLDDHCFRVAAQTPEADDLLIEAIKAYQQLSGS